MRYWQEGVKGSLTFSPWNNHHHHHCHRHHHRHHHRQQILQFLLSDPREPPQPSMFLLRAVGLLRWTLKGDADHYSPHWGGVVTIFIIIKICFQKLTSAHELESLFEIFGVDGQVKHEEEENPFATKIKLLLAVVHCIKAQPGDGPAGLSKY